MNEEIHRIDHQALLAEFQNLWTEADAIWDRLQETPPFHGYVSADYQAVFDSLLQMRGRVLTVLEMGSGLGVVAIMASRMGYDAFGIEAEPELVAHAQCLAERYGAEPRFAQGSFIPDEFRWNPADGDHAYRTIIDTASAYADLDMELRDFELIYAYPWPDEHTLYHNIIRAHGHPRAIFLSYDAREGIDLVRFGDRGQRSDHE